MSADVVEQVEGEDTSTPSHGMLRSFIDRIERLDDQISDLRGDRKEVVAEAKASGFDATALREVIKRRKADPEKLAELDALVDTYECALGGTPRGMIWGGELRPQAALAAPKATDRSRRADEAAVLANAARLAAEQ